MAPCQPGSIVPARSPEAAFPRLAPGISAWCWLATATVYRAPPPTGAPSSAQFPQQFFGMDRSIANAPHLNCSGNRSQGGSLPDGAAAGQRERTRGQQRVPCTGHIFGGGIQDAHPVSQPVIRFVVTCVHQQALFTQLEQDIVGCRLLPQRRGQHYQSILAVAGADPSLMLGGSGG